MLAYRDNRFLTLAAWAVIALTSIKLCPAQDVSAPAFSEYFTSPTVPLNGTVMLDFSISNSNTETMTGISFTANLPSGLTVAPMPTVTNTCGGSVTALAGGSSVALSAGSLTQTSCDVAVSVSGAAVGPQTVDPTQVNSSDGLSNTASASVTVVPPPALTVGFGTPSVELGASTLLTFTVQNNSPAISLTGVAFNNTLPSGLLVATPAGVIGSCGGGIVSAPPGAATITLYGGSIASGGFCSVSVNVQGIGTGEQQDATSPILSSEGGQGDSAMSKLTVSPASSPKGFCVASASGLQTALTAAAANTSVNDIRLKSGVYALASPLVYAPSNTKVTIMSGGWDSSCATQTLNNEVTVLDAGGQHQALGYPAPSVAGNLALQNLTIRNGVSAHQGGCLFVNTGGSFQIVDSTVENCQAGSGGGLWVEHASSLLISKATFSGNQATDGAAVAINQMHAGSATIDGTDFNANQSTGDSSGNDGASAISVQDFTSPPIAAFWLNDSIFRNGKGHAVNIGASSMVVSDSAFLDNTDTQHTGYLQAECGYFAGVPRIQNPVSVGQLLIVDSTFAGSGAANSGCMAATASGASGSLVDVVKIRNSMFSGFTAGVFPLNLASGTPLPELSASYCDLRGNTFDANSGGAAVVPYCTSLAMSHNKFLSNVGAAGSPGGLYVHLGSGIVVDDNLFAGNTGNGNGGAVGLDLVISPPGVVYPLPTGTYVFSNNTFAGNQTSGYGGALSIQSQFGANPTIQLWNNLFWSNAAGSGLGSDIYFNNDYLQSFNLTPITLNSNAYLQATAGFYMSIPAAPLGSGNINASNPLFINPGAWDFRLAAGSPMVDSGNDSAPGLDALDLSGLPRIDGGSVDIGAFEYNGDEIFRSAFEEVEY